ncbi:MAG: hypothetical protein II765_04045, partial [Lachnospiraceae bacterium]|nr:hypothetical protein [Lachnospiraceae bacterium]
MINGKLAPNILKFALPLAATGILQQLFNAADVAVIGRFAGKEAMAAVGSQTVFPRLYSTWCCVRSSGSHSKPTVSSAFPALSTSSLAT